MHLAATLERLRPPLVTQSDGSQEPDWDAPENQWSKAIFKCSPFQGLTSAEDLVARTRIKSTHATIVEPDADIRPPDRVRYNLQDYEVDGDPIELRDALDRLWGWQVYVFRITGG